MKNEKYALRYIAVTVLYVGLTFGLPPNQQTLDRYDISSLKLRVINLSITIPLLMIFAYALFGFLRFKSYAHSIRKTKEGKPINHLATGLMVLAFSLPLGGATSSLLNYIAANNPDLLPMTTITRNYVSVAFQFVAFLYIAKGAQDLVNTLGEKKIPKPKYGLLGTIVLACIFTWLIAIRPADATGEKTYYLPDLLIISTLAIPYLYTWCRGILAAYQLYAYKDRVKGTIYKNSIAYLARGISYIVIISIAVQLITTLSVRLTRLSLTPLLLIVYVLVAFYAVGYGMVAHGAKKLKKIEEV